MASPKPKPYSLNPEPIRFSIVAPIIALVAFFTPIPAWIIDDFYSRDMYRWLQSMMTVATNVLPFAVLDLMLLVVIFLVGYRTVRLFHVLRQRGVIDALWEAVRRLLRGVSIGVILFLWAWGFNYRRVPLDQAVHGAAGSRLTAESLQTAFADAASLAARLRPIVESEGRFASIAIELKEPMNAALRALGRETLRTPSQPKYSLLLTPFFRAAGVTGMMNPFGHETIVLPDLLPHERPFVLAHEWAHLSGHADEAEASAIGWLACMKGGPALAYSASMYLIHEAAAALPEDARAALFEKLDPGVRADIDAVNERLRKGQPSIQRTASRVYDEYLRANRVADGTASYARALQLIVSPPFMKALSSYTISR